MNEIRGEKVRFGKGDIVCLHSLPSAQAHEPIVLHCTDRPSHLVVCLRLVVGVAAFVTLLAILVVGAVESGLIDAPLNARAVVALNRAVGPNHVVSVEKTVLRFSSLGGLALKAENVALADSASGRNVANAGAVSIVLDPLALLSGRVSPSSLEIDRAMFDPALLPKGPAVDFSAVRLDAIPAYQDIAFTQLERLGDAIGHNGLSRVRITNLELPLAVGTRPLRLEVERLTFARSGAGDMSIDGRYALDGQPGEVELRAFARNGAGEVSGLISGIPVGAIALRHTSDGEPRTGVDALADLSLTAARGAAGTVPRLELAIASEGGTLYVGGVGATLKPTAIAAHYDFERNSFEIAPSAIRVGSSVFPFSGGLIDFDRLPGQTGPGFGIDLLVSDAVSAPEDTGEPPVRFDAKLAGRMLPATGEVRFDELGISSNHGSLAGSLALAFGDGSPAVSFAMVSDRVQAVAVKQLWPFWMAKKARQWVISNMFGGTVTNGRIEVSMAAGRAPDAEGRLQLGRGELAISFDIEETRVNIAGAIPPLRDASGHFELDGEQIDVDIHSGTAYMPEGRAVTVSGGTFRLADSYARPLMADLDINLAGASDAVAQLITYEPIDVLKRTEFTPADFTGPVAVNVRAHVGLVRDQNPPPPQWSAAIDLQGVDLQKPITGRKVSQLEGRLEVDASRAHLTADARIDQVPLAIDLVEPVGKASGQKRALSITGTIGERDRAQLFPGLNDLVAGPMGLALTTQEDGRQKIETDLGRSVVSLPWVGWSKGAGVPAKASFLLDNRDGATQLSDFKFSGDGFALAGNVVLNGAALKSAQFDEVRLSAQDRFSLSIERARAGYAVKVRGDLVDVRPVLANIKSGPAAGGGDRDAAAVTLHASVGRVIGFNGEALGNVSLDYASAGGRLSGLNLSGVTGSGQALVARLNKDRGAGTLELTSGDAGAVARLADIYRHMEGGLLNVRLKAGADGAWRGPVDIRKFKLTGEEKLRSIVSTPAGGRSLNEAVRKEIDTSSMAFSRGFAFVVAKDGTLRVENGVVRGEAVGATFQGTVRDGNGRMELTGTFMPAYGLNRLFAELPVIGFILGNGSDRGLIGITFKLSGPFDRPGLMVNPLSIIAPGVFRNIFEF